MSEPYEAREILAKAQSVLIVDWPTPDVPASLARAGLRVFVHGGPRPDQYTEHEVSGDEIVVRDVGRAPDHADLVYAYRPVAELSDIVALAQAVGARTVWSHPASPPSAKEEQRARTVVESAGLRYMSSPGIVDEVRRARVHAPGAPS